MHLSFFNTLTKKNEKFKPISDGKVGLYTCGPTVYNFSHIGNFRTFIFEDLLKRWLLHLGYEVNHVMNITDVDDKTIKKSIDEKVVLKDITKKYSKIFFEDLKWLDIIPASHFPMATDHIPEMILMIKALIKKEMAYLDKDGSVYFRISSYSDYGKLANIRNLNSSDSIVNIEADEYSAEYAQDFALWKRWKETDGDVFWDSPWGKGRPGWHIECSAMSTKHLGNNFDIHCGGVDNIFPHHENEIAQSVGANGKKFVNYWLHSEHLMINGDKMSKKENNFFTIKHLKSLGFSAQSIRHQLLAGHYRTKISFSTKKKYESDKIINRITDFYYTLIDYGAKDISGNKYPEAYDIFKSHLNNDLDTPKALAVFLKWMKSEMGKIQSNEITKLGIRSAWNFVRAFDFLFRFVKYKDNEIPSHIRELLSERQKARDIKDWGHSDVLREELLSHGYMIEDTINGQKIKEIRA